MTRTAIYLGCISSIFVLMTTAADAQYGSPPPPPSVFVIHGIGRTCDSINNLDRALSIADQQYFLGWTVSDFDAAAAWGAACVVDGYQYLAHARVARLREYQSGAFRPIEPAARTQKRTEDQAVVDHAKGIADKIIAENAALAADEKTSRVAPPRKSAGRLIAVRDGAPRQVSSSSKIDDDRLRDENAVANFVSAEEHNNGHTAVIASSAPSAPVSAQEARSSDAQAVKSIRDQLANIETTYGVTTDALAGFFNQVERGEIDAANRDALNATFTSNLRMGKTILAQSQNILTPKISDPVVRGYVIQVIEAHKAWARDLEKRNNAFFSDHPDIERAIRYKDAADADASREAATLILAYNAVGLRIE